MEFYRFISAVMILCYHCYWFAFREEGTQFVGFYLFVELFFILSGFLMMGSIRHHVTDEQRLDAAGATWAYIRGRLRQLYPHHLLSWVLVAFILLFVTKELFPIELFQVGIPELLLVNIFGFVRGEYINIVCWYLSALVFASAVIYYLLMKDEDGFIKVIGPILMVLCYGVLFDRKGSLANTILFTRYSAFLGFYRALADITAGCIAYRVYEWMGDVELPEEWLLATILEVMVILASVLWMYGNSGKFDFAFVPLFFAFVISVFRGKSLLTKALDNPVSGWLGKQSYAYFLNNLVVVYPYMYFFPESNIWTMCLVCVPTCFVVSVITGNVLKKLTR
jgi:peptidoglycan/LPS O-acetylase OafA/YrhL